MRRLQALMPKPTPYPSGKSTRGIRRVLSSRIWNEAEKVTFTFHFGRVKHAYPPFGLPFAGDQAGRLGDALRQTFTIFMGPSIIPRYSYIDICAYGLLLSAIDAERQCSEIHSRSRAMRRSRSFRHSMPPIIPKPATLPA
jgi:hypothetical protein